MTYYTPNNTEFVYAVIYKWTNKLNGKSYIGQTINEVERHSRHISVSFNPNVPGYNYHLHRAIRKYGIESFNYSVLMRVHCPKIFAREILNKNEEYYIKLYDTFNNGYNTTKGGDSVKGHEWSEEERKNQSEEIKGRMAGDKNPMYRSVWTQRQKDSNYRKVLKYDLDGNFIEEFDSMKDAAKSVNKTHTGNISICCAGKRNKAYGFIWKYKE